MADKESSKESESQHLLKEVEHVASVVENDVENVSEGILRKFEGFSEREIFHKLNSMNLQETTLEVLHLLDITLLGNLVVIIVFSGYENFVSKIGIAEESIDRPSWMGKVDYSGLKIKLIGSLVAISVIELLRDFMNADMIDTSKESWRIAIHATFVLSGVLFALMDFIADRRAIVELEIERRDLELENLREEINQFKREHRHNNHRRGNISAD